MARTAIITGLPGTDIDTYLNNERDIIVSERWLDARKSLKKEGVRGKELERELENQIGNIEEKVKIYNVGKEMEAVALDMSLSYDFRHILQLDREKRNMLIRMACREIERKINRIDKPEVAIIRTHATFYEPKSLQATQSAFPKDFRDMTIDRVCCILDDEVLVKERLRQYPQFKKIKFTNKDILHWSSQEIETSERLFGNTRTKKKWNDRMQVFSRYMSTTSLYKFLMFDDVPVIYAAYPITQVQGNDKVESEVEKGIMMLNKYGIIKNPKAGDVGANKEALVGKIDRNKAREDESFRSTYCVNRDIDYLVSKSHILVGNYPIDTSSDGMVTEMWDAMNKTKLTILKVGKSTRELVSPFRVYSPRYITRSYNKMEKILQEEGYNPIFKDLMKRWEKEYRRIDR